MIKLNVNNQEFNVDVDADTPLLWVLRENIGLQGTKFGCGKGVCGACSVLVNGNVVRSCSYPAAAAVGAKIETIEGLSPNNSHPLQQAWIEEEVPQCGYCQSGQIMTAFALLKRQPDPSDQQIDEAMNVVCRCGTHQRIRKGIKRAAQLVKG